MKAISLWQPHVAAIALGLKPWETRSAKHWTTSYRGPLALQAAKRAWDDIDEWHAEAAVRLMRRCSELVAAHYPEIDPEHHRRARNYLHERVLVFGAVVCIADLVDCVPTWKLRGKIPPEHEFWGDFSDGEDGKGRVALKLENVRLLKEPLPWRGQQGFFDVPFTDASGQSSVVSEQQSPDAQLSLFGGAA